MTTKETFFVKVFDSNMPEIVGYGECALFRGLSADDTPEFENLLDRCCREIDHIDISTIPSSAIRFGLETAVADLNGGGTMRPFSSADFDIAINGLVWMGSEEFMVNEAAKKIDDGFRCLKFKIGGIDFEREVSILQSIRERFSEAEMEIRLDANGSFTPENALARLERLAAFDIHSIEQPLKPEFEEEMAELCRVSPIPIALDEQLIGITSSTRKRSMLQRICPTYIILKPSLCGGFAEAAEWIDIAATEGIGWWITSALESNIGLNAIARFANTYQLKMPQGLGTGKIYTDNIKSPLEMRGARLVYDNDKLWDLSVLNF